MNYEEKYKEALERARYYHSKDYMLINSAIENIFPELKESEDEKMRKNGTFIPADEEHKKEIEMCISWLEKQGEKKPTDKVEPKFKVCNWITDGNYTWEVTDIMEFDYVLRSQDGNIVDDTISYVDKEFNFWTIQDAKDGDVLASKDRNDILIFRNLDNNKSFSSYYNIKKKGEIGWSNETFIPANKEQRDLLFQEMKEAGYEWDAKRKELKKMEVASKESEDERIRKEIIEYVTLYKDSLCDKEYNSWIAWLEKQDNKSVNIDVESMVSSYEQKLESQSGTKYSPLVNMCLTAFRHGVENVLEELNLKKLEKQGEKKRD